MIGPAQIQNAERPPPGDPVVTRHIYSGIETIEEYILCSSPEDPNWALAREFVWGGSFPEPVALIDHTALGDKVAGVEEVLHYVRDELGNVVGLTDAGDPNASPRSRPRWSSGTTTTRTAGKAGQPPI